MDIYGRENISVWTVCPILRYLSSLASVSTAANDQPHDHKRSVFVGNLPFDVQDEDLYTHFARCGEIEFVRAVRDKKTNVGKGFGYVQFKVFPSGRKVTNGRSEMRWIKLCC